MLTIKFSYTYILAKQVKEIGSLVIVMLSWKVALIFKSDKFSPGRPLWHMTYDMTWHSKDRGTNEVIGCEQLTELCYSTWVNKLPWMINKDLVSR